jgi:hypothetical protein
VRWRVLAILGLVACGEGGGVAVHLGIPESPELDPFGQPIAELTLTAFADGRTIYSATRPSGSLEFGRIPVAEDVQFELAAVAPTGRVIGFGRSAELVDVAHDRSVEVELEMRRPFAYVSGSPTMLAIDGTLEPGRDYAAPITLGGQVSAAAALPNGNEVIISIGGGLERVSTSTHAPIGQRVELGKPVTDLAVSPNGRWAVAAHFVEPTGVTVVALDGSRDPVFVPTAKASAVALDDETAWVLLNPVDNIFCVGESTVVAVPLLEPQLIGEPVVLGTVAGDVAVDPDSGAAVVTLPCLGRVVTIAHATATPVVLLDVDGPSAVAVARGKVWVMGHRDREGAHLILASVAIGGGPVTVLDMPTQEERARAPELDQEGQGGLIQMTADLLSAFDISVLPDSAHVAVLVAAVYGTVASGDAGGGQPILPKLTMITYEYQLLQLDTGLGAQRLRLSCELAWDPGALIDDFVCARAPGQDEAAVSFTPTDLTVLYGSR